MADDTKLDTTPPDPSPYIRTMAKDVALLTGRGAPVSGTAAKKDTQESGVLLPEVDESPVAYKDAVPKDFTQEVLQTSKEDEAGVIAQKQTGASVFSSIPQAPIEVTPSVLQPAETERQSILERLRGQVRQETVSETPTLAAPGDVTPGIPPVSKETPVQPPAPMTTAVPPPPPPPQPIAGIPDPANLHTYKTDFADRIDQKQATTFSVLAAAGDAGQSTAAVSKVRRSVAPVIIGIVLVVAGAGIGLGALYYVTSRPQVAQVVEVPALVIPDETIELTGSGADMYARIAALGNEASVDGNVYVTYVATTTPTQKGVTKTPLPGGYLIAQLPLGAPTILVRNLDPISTAGVIDTGSETRAFFILRVTSYERSFAGMLAWEATMGESLKALYPEFLEPVVPVATTTATTTPGKKSVPATPSVPVTPVPPRFVDQVVANHDVRALKDNKGRTILLYGYRDKTTLIIARNEDAFTALINRLTATPQ